MVIYINVFIIKYYVMHLYLYIQTIVYLSNLLLISSWYILPIIFSTKKKNLIYVVICGVLLEVMCKSEAYL